MDIELNKVYHADSVDKQGMCILPPKCIDLIFADLPYGTTSCKWDIIIPFDILWQQYERIIKDNGVILLTACQPFTSLVVSSNLKLFKYDWIWQKTHPKGHLNSKKMPMRAHEHVLVFYKNRPTYNPQKTYGHNRKVAKTNYTKEGDGSSVYGKEVRNTNYDSTERLPLSVQVFANADLTTVLHPTQKPVSLVEYFINTYSNEGDIVLDNVMGSGTTAIAAINTKRSYIGFEKEEKYFNTIGDRISNHKSGNSLVVKHGKIITPNFVQQQLI